MNQQNANRRTDTVNMLVVAGGVASWETSEKGEGTEKRRLVVTR